MGIKFYAERGISVGGFVDVTHFLAVNEIDGVRYTQIVPANERQSVAEQWASGDMSGADKHLILADVHKNA